MPDRTMMNANGAGHIVVLIVVSAFGVGPASGDDDFRCLREIDGGASALEWRIVSGSTGRKARGLVRYKGATTAISIVLRKTVATDTPDGRPWEYTSTWDEIARGTVTGEYVVTTQGGNVYGFTYRKTGTATEIRYVQDLSAMRRTRCVW